LAVYSYGALEVPFVGVLISAITPVLLPEFSAAWARGDRARILDLWGARHAAHRRLPSRAIFSCSRWPSRFLIFSIKNTRQRPLFPALPFCCPCDNRLCPMLLALGARAGRSPARWWICPEPHAERLARGPLEMLGPAAEP
jgi:hypothetical protein